jgi:hypothetical protein
MDFCQLLKLFFVIELGAPIVALEGPISNRLGAVLR